MQTDHNDATATGSQSRALALKPVDDGEFTRTGLWLMMAGCCLSLPIALGVLAVTGTSLAASRPVFVGIFAVAAGALAAIGLTRHLTVSHRGTQ